MSKYFYHGTRTIDTILQVFNCQEIQSQRLQGFEKSYGYNGLDYISLCKKEDNKEYVTRRKNSFNGYIKGNFCFIISDEIDALKTEYKNCDNMTYEELQIFLSEHSDTRYSDMFDEWQVRDSISLKYIVGIGLTIDKILERIEDDKNKCFFYDVKSLLGIIKELKLDIIDTCEEDFVEKYEAKLCNNEKCLEKLMGVVYE